VRIREGLDGKDRVVLTGRIRPKISPDGSKIGYSPLPGTKPAGLFLVDPAGGQSTELLGAQERATIFDWTPDGERLLFWHGTPIRFSVADPRTRQQQVLISHPTLNIHTLALSPDSKWAAFILTDRGRSLMVAPVRDGKAADEGEWVTVGRPPAQHARPWWSPDGNLLYFVSDRDRYECIWAQRLNPTTRRAAGDPIPVFHLHETRRSTLAGAAPFGPAVGRDHLVFGLLDQTANVWIAEPAAQ
jgi:Tol biopolymer transport system component